MKNKQYITTAKAIIEHKGHCHTSWIHCDTCPLHELLKGHLHIKVLGLSNDVHDDKYIKAKVKWFKNWLKENDK